MKTQHAKMAIWGTGILLLATSMQSFSPGDDKEKMKRYEVIHHANGQTLEFDTLVPMSSAYTVEQFLTDKGIKAENIKVIKVPAIGEGGMMFVHEADAENPQIIVRELHGEEGLNWEDAEGKELKIICEMGPDGKMHTRKIVDGEEVEMTELEVQQMKEKTGNPGERRIVIRTESEEHTANLARDAEEKTKMEVKIKCEIDENGEVHARKWVNGEEVEMTEEELEQMKTPHEEGQVVIIRMDQNSEGRDPGEEQIIEIEQILEEMGVEEGGSGQMIFIEKEINEGEGQERKVIHIDGEAPVEWTEGTHTEVRKISSDEENFTVVMITENVDPAASQPARAAKVAEPKQISVYPNPTSGAVTIEFVNSEKVKTAVKITDMNGKVVFSEDLGKFAGAWRKEVNLNQFGKGTYLITIDQGKQTVNEKVMVE